MSGWGKWNGEKTQAYVWGQIFWRNQEKSWGFPFFYPSILPFFCWVLLWSTRIFTLPMLMAPAGGSQKWMQALVNSQMLREAQARAWGLWSAKIHQQALWQCQTQLLNTQISRLEQHPCWRGSETFGQGLHTVPCRQGEALWIKMSAFPRAPRDIYKSNSKCSLLKHGHWQSCRHTTPSCSTFTSLGPPSQLLAISCPSIPASPGSNPALVNASTVWDPAPSLTFRSQELPTQPLCHQPWPISALYKWGSSGKVK